MPGIPPPNLPEWIERGVLRLWARLPARRLRSLAEWSYTPKFMVDAVGLVFDTNDYVLLVHHTYKQPDPWGLPGGGLHYGETPEAAARRELWEEAGIAVEVGPLLGTHTDAARRQIKLFYLCRLCRAGQQQFRRSAEIDAFGYFPPQGLPAGTAPLVAEVLDRFSGGLAPVVQPCGARSPSDG